MKALAKISSLIETNEKETVVLIIPEMCRQLSNIFLENSWRVRAETYKTMGALVEKVKKSFGNNLKTVIGIWICSLFDPVNEVSSAASKSLYLTIPEKKLPKALTVLFDNIIEQVQENLDETIDSLGFNLFHLVFLSFTEIKKKNSKGKDC